MSDFEINSYIESAIPNIYQIKGWKTDHNPYYKYEHSIEDKNQLVIGISNITSQHIYSLLKSTYIIDLSIGMSQYATAIDFYNRLLYKEARTKFFCMIKIVKDINNNTTQYHFCFIKPISLLAIQIYQDSEQCVCLKNNLKRQYPYEKNYRNSYKAYKDMIDYFNGLVDRYIDHNILSFNNVNQFEDLISILRI